MNVAPDRPWPLPSELERTDGEQRRVGVELELQGIAVAELAERVADVLSGAVRSVSSVRFEVDPGTGAGSERDDGPGEGAPWRVEVDYRLLQELAEQAQAGDTFRGLLTDALATASSLVVPCEIVSPPLRMAAMHAPLDRLVPALRTAGARGTRHTPWYAFGVHFNIDPPALDAGTLLALLQAFVCAYDWLLWRGRVDPARRLTPYIDGYPRDYELLITGADYRPDLARLADDYLTHNPTRNRALDLLPLLMHLDEERVRSVVDDDLVLPRPALHYRLPNCSVDEADWSLRRPWSHWVAVERLAADAAALADCRAAFRRHRQDMLHPLKSDWRKRSAQWLEP